MKDRIILLLTVCIVGAAAVAGALLCEKKSDARMIRSTLDYTDEEIAALPYFNIIAAKDENRYMPCDIEGYSLGDGYIHLMLPAEVPESSVVVYITDIEGSYLARRIFDFTDTVMIGPWEVLLEHHSRPTLYFESDDPGVFASMIGSETKDIICDGNVHVCDGGEETHVFDELSVGVKASLQGRGNNSWDANCKKSYSLRLEKSQDLLGMGKNRSWNLIGNAYDSSLLKNITFNSIAGDAGIEYQPVMQNVNLYVDGRYNGVYTLTTKVTVGKNRVALRKGDFFYKMDPPTCDRPVAYNSKTWFPDGTDSPCADLLYPEDATDQELRRASDLLQGFINEIENDGMDRQYKICDISSLAKYYWVEEASMNFDAWQRSTYMYYRNSDGMIHMGPVWDMDLTLGSPYTKEGIPFDSPEGWKVRNAGWYKALFEDPSFVKEVTDQYHSGGVRDALLSGAEEFERQKELLGPDGYLNYLMFGHANDIGEGSVYGEIYDYDEYCAAVTDWYRARIEWIDGQMSR